MKHCDLCGRAVDDAHPLRFCPECLFGLDAAEVPPEPDAPVPAPFALPGGPAVSRLTARPDFFRKYDVLDQVGQGGQGEVWKVWDFEFCRTVAMKRLGDKALASPSAVYRFLAEAQIASQLEHPGILPVFDVGLDPDGRPFYTTQLLPGTTLADVWAEAPGPGPASGQPGPAGSPRKEPVASPAAPWTTRRALELLLRVCEVMAYAHRRGVIHRDLKPQNILIGPFGDVRVIDWGSAKILERARKDFEDTFVPLDGPSVQTDRQEAMAADPDSPLPTGSSGQPITIEFTPPEILRGDPDAAGPETDIYSLGVMLYQRLSGRLPYSDPDGTLPPRTELQARIQAGPPRPVRAVRSGIARDLAAICGKAMAHDKAGRYRAMDDLAADLRAFLEIRPVRARNPGPILRLQKFVLRNLSYVFLGTLLVAGAAVGWLAAQSLKAQRDAARQVRALSEAELAARSGRWHEALRQWDIAEAAGYEDVVALSLNRAEGWIVVSEKMRARALLTNLLTRPDLDARRGAVLLRVGEHEMFDRALSDQGVRHVREALGIGLAGADDWLAKGLLAESTPEALAAFRRALELNPHFHSAHRHALGLEFVLGRFDEFERHLESLRTLYPGEFSPGFLEASVLALRGNLTGARTNLAGLRGKAGPDLLGRLEKGLGLLANAADAFHIDVRLGSRPARVSRRQLMAEAMLSLAARSTGTDGAPDAGLPALPCVRQGIQEGFEGVRDLLLPGRLDDALARIRSAWRRHPEALFPFFAAEQLDSRQPAEGRRDLTLLATQAEFYQMAADSPSVLPTLTRHALLRAVDTQSELAYRQPTQVAARTLCVSNLHRALFLADASAGECRIYSGRALDLGERDLARAFQSRWERLQPGNTEAVRQRVDLEIESGAYGPALRLLDQMLAADPNDRFARSRKQSVLRKIAALKEEASVPSARPAR